MQRYDWIGHMGRFSENTDIATYWLNQPRGQPSENRAHCVIAKPFHANVGHLRSKPCTQGLVIKFIEEQQFFINDFLADTV